VIAGAAIAPRVVEEFVVGLHLRAGQSFFTAQLRIAAPHGSLVSGRQVLPVYIGQRIDQAGQEFSISAGRTASAPLRRTDAAQSADRRRWRAGWVPPTGIAA
jgi:hypothetical protein